MKHGVISYRGEAPRITPRELPDNAAQQAINARLQTGDLEAWRQFASVKALATPAVVRTIYLLNGSWLSWGQQVDVARGLVPGDTTFRTFLTCPALYTTPRWTNFSMATTGAEPYPVTTRPLGVPEPDTAPTLVVGVDSTPTSFSIDETDDNASLATSWTTGPLLVGTTYASVVQQVGYYEVKYDENRNPGEEPFAYRNFGVEGVSVLNVSCDIRFEGDTSIRQATIVCGVGVAGDGVAVTYQQGFLQIRKIVGWSPQFGMAILASVAVGPPLSAATTYSLRCAVVANEDGTKTVTGSVWNSLGTIQLATITATNNFADGDFCGFSNGITDDASSQYQTRYSNYHVLASGSNDYTAINTATAYVYTFVSDIGEESAPSPASSEILRPDGVSVTVTTPTTTPGGTDPLYGITEKRIYRAVSGSTGTVFRRVATIPLATADYIDVLDDAQLSKDLLESEDWDLPPANLQGMKALPNGIMCGFFANQLCFSEQGRPHAWPIKYRRTTDTDIVAIDNIDNTIVIGTKSFVYTATGNTPGSYSMSQPGSPQACVSKLSMRYVEGVGVFFASPDGYQVCAGSAGHVQNATEGIFTKLQWEALDPSSIIAAVYDRVLHFFFTGTTPDRGYALDVRPSGFGLITLAYHATAMHADPLTDYLYLVLDAVSEPTDPSLPIAPTPPTPNGTTIYRFDAGPGLMTFQWRGKLNLMPWPTTLHFGKVRAAGFTNLLLRVYGDGVQILERTITNNQAFRLPGRSTYESYEFELLGTSTIRGHQGAEDVMELT